MNKCDKCGEYWTEQCPNCYAKAKASVVSSAWFADVVSYITDQSKQFRQCAGHHAEHNRGAESVALRAAEILDRIAADIRSANNRISAGDGR